MGLAHLDPVRFSAILKNIYNKRENGALIFPFVNNGNQDPKRDSCSSKKYFSFHANENFISIMPFIKVVLIIIKVVP